MAWIEYHTALRDHWKIKRLATFLDVDYLHALGAVSCLWLWVAEYAPDGNVTRFTDAEIRDAARCNLEKFSKNILKECELVDAKGKINDWSKHGLKLLESRRKRQREYMKRKRKIYVESTSTSTSTVPNRTIPNHIYCVPTGTNKVFDTFCLKYKETFGKEYVANFGKDKKLFKDLLKVVPEQETIELINRFFTSDDDFIVKSGYTPGVFKSQINKLRGSVKATTLVFKKE